LPAFEAEVGHHCQMTDKSADSVAVHWQVVSVSWVNNSWGCSRECSQPKKRPVIYVFATLAGRVSFMGE